MIHKQVIKSNLTIVILWFALVFNSCSYFTEPEPYVNSEARPAPEVKSVDILLYKPGQHVGGTITITYFPQIIPPQSVYQVILFIDTVSISPEYGYIATFRVNTTSWSQALHTLRFEVWKTYNHLGIEANLRNAPSESYKTTLIFDQTSPIAPLNVKITNVNGHPHLSWQGSAFSSFFCYVIKKNGTPLDTLFSQSDSSFDDSQYKLADFDKVSYSVGSSNAGTVAYSSPVTLQYGQSLSLNSAKGILDDFNERAIFQSDYSIIHSDFSVDFYSYIISASTKTSGVLTNLLISAESGVCPAAKSPDGTRFFLWEHDYGSILEFDSIFQAVNQPYIAIPGRNYKFAVGLEEKIYYSLGTGALFIFKKDGTTSGPYNIFDGPVNFISISPDGSTMLVADNKGIKNYSLRGDSSVLTLQSSVKDQISLFRVDWNKSNIFIVRQNKIIEAWDISTLNSMSSFQVSASMPATSEITAITTNSKYLYVAYTVQHNGSAASIVVEYDLATHQQTRSWSFPSVIQSLLGSEHGRYLFACTSTDQWIVDIGGTP